MGTNTFRLSRETKKELGKNLDFFDHVDRLTKELSLGFDSGDAELRTESETLPNGDLKVTYIYPLDNNRNPGDGRVYLKDSFVFDSAEQELKKYQRFYDLHPSVQADPRWQEKLKKFQETPALALGDARLQKFAFRVGLSFSRPIDDPVKKILKEQIAYLNEANVAAQALDNTWTLRVGDKLSHFSRVYRDGELIVTVTLPVDADKDPTKGRILFSDQFTLDPHSLKLKSVSRSWGVAPEVEGPERDQLKAVVVKLNGGGNPPLAEAEKFFTALAPALGVHALKSSLDSTSLTPVLPKGIPVVTPNSFAGRAQVLDRKNIERAAAAAENAALGLNLALDILQNKHDAGAALLIFAPKIDRTKIEASLKSVFSKAGEKAATRPDLSFAEQLRSLDLNEAEKQALDLIASDTIFKKFVAITAEPNAELRAHELALLARQDLIPHQMQGTTQAIAAGLKALPENAGTALELTNLLEGKGGFGTKLEILLPRFVEQSSNPWMVAGMVASGFAAPLAEVATLRLLRNFGTVGSIGRFGARVAGIGMESLAFNTTHRLGASLTNNPETVWKNYGHDILSGTMLFGALRLSHQGTGAVGRGMAEGRLSTYLGGRMPDSSYALTRWGRTSSELLNHSAAILTMAGAAKLSAAYGLHPASDQGVGGNLFDATVMYTQAMIGGRLSNFLSRGRLQPEMAEIRRRVHEEYRSAFLDPSASSKIPSWEVFFTQKTSELSSWTLAKWKGANGEKISDRLTTRHLPENLVQQVLADAAAEQSGIKQASAFRKGLSRLWTQAGERLGSWGPAQGIFEYFSFLKLSRQRAIKQSITGLETEIQTLTQAKESALETASVHAEEVERLESAIDEIIDRHLPELVDDPSLIATPEGRQSKKQEIKEKIKQLTTDRDKAVVAQQQAENEARQKTEQVAERDQTIIRLEGENQNLGLTKTSLEAQLAILSSDLAEAVGNAEVAEENLTLSGHQLLGSRSETASALAEVGVQGERIAGLEKEIADLTDNLQEVTAARDTSLATVTAKETEIATLQGQAKALEKELELLQTALRQESDLIELPWTVNNPELSSNLANQHLQEIEKQLFGMRRSLRLATNEAIEIKKRIEKTRKDYPHDQTRIDAGITELKDRAARIEQLVVRLQKAKEIELATRIKFFELRLAEEVRGRELDTTGAKERIAGLGKDLEGANQELSRLKGIEAERNSLQVELDETIRARDAAATNAREWETYAGKRNTELTQVNGKLVAARAIIAALEQTKLDLEGKVSANAKVIAKLENEKQTAEDGLAATTDELERTRNSREHFKSEAERFEREKTALETRLAEATDRYQKLDKEAGEMAELSTQADARHANEGQEWDIDKSKLNARISELEVELEGKTEELAQALAGYETALNTKESEWSRRYNNDLVELEKGLRLGFDVQEEALNVQLDEQTRLARENGDALDGLQQRFESLQREIDSAQIQLATLPEITQITEMPVMDRLTTPSPEPTDPVTIRMAELQTRINTLESQSAPLRKQVEDLTRDNGELLAQVAQAQKELKEHLEAAETVIAEDHNVHAQRADALGARVLELQAEATLSTNKIQGLETAAFELQEELRGVNSVLEARAAATISPFRFYGDIDPRVARSEISFNAITILHDAQGRPIGEGHLISGGAQGSLAFLLPDGSKILGKTSIGFGRKKNEDGIVAGYYIRSDGMLVKWMQPGDGAGGQGDGKWASTAHLQGGAARFVEMAEADGIPLAADLFEQGVVAVRTQKSLPEKPMAPDAAGSGDSIVVVGNQATIATAGDSTVLHLRKNGQGRFEVLGYSHVDGMFVPNGGPNFRKNIIYKSIGGLDYHKYAIDDLREGDVLLICSDGPWEAWLGDLLKLYASEQSRKVNNLREPNQLVFENVSAVLDIFDGRHDVAEFILDWAVHNARHPGQTLTRKGRTISLPTGVEGDNDLVMYYRHGRSMNYQLQIPDDYQALPGVYDWAETERMQENAERSTNKGNKAAEELPSDLLVEEPTPTEPVGPPVPPPSPRGRRSSPPPPPPAEAQAVARPPVDEMLEDEGSSGRAYPELHFMPEQTSLVIGREPTVQDEPVQVIADDKISRDHARIYLKDGKYYLQHFGRNSTIVKYAGMSSVLTERATEAKLRDGALVLMGNSGFIFRAPNAQPVAAEGGGETATPAKYVHGSQAQKLDFFRKYNDLILGLYGTNGGQVGEGLINLYANFPALEAVFNPKLMSEVPEAAAGRHAQENLLTALRNTFAKSLQEMAPDEVFIQKAKADLESAEKGFKPVPIADAAAISGIRQKYDGFIHALFTGKEQEVAALFANLYAVDPQLESKINPLEIFKTDWRALVSLYRALTISQMPDRHWETEKLIFNQSFNILNQLRDFSDRALNGWELVPGIFQLLPGRAYAIGSDKKMKIRVEDPAVASEHFRIFSDAKGWHLQNLDPANVTAVNMLQVRDATWTLNHDDMIMVGSQWLNFQIQSDGKARLEWVKPRADQSAAAPSAVPNPWAVAQGFYAEVPPDAGPVVLGRLQLNHPLVSAQHVAFRRNGKFYEVRDEGSHNGLLLNAVQIAGVMSPDTRTRPPGQWKELQVGDSLVVGPFQLDVGVNATTGGLTLTQATFASNATGAQPASATATYQEGRLTMNQTPRIALQTVRVGKLGFKEDGHLGDGGLALNVGRDLLSAKRYGIIERNGDTALLKVEHAGLSIRRGDKTFHPEKGEMKLQPGDRLGLAGEEFDFYL